MGVNIKIERAYQFGEFLSSAHEGEELNGKNRKNIGL